MSNKIKIFLSTLLLAILPFYGAIYTKANIIWPVSVLMYNLGLFYLVSAISKRPMRLVFYYIVASAFFVFESAYFVSFYLQNHGFNEAFFYHLRPDIIYAGVGEHLVLLLIVVIIYLGALISPTLEILRGRSSKGLISLVWCCVVVFGLVVSPSVSSFAHYLHNSKKENLELYTAFPEIKDNELTVEFEKSNRLNIVLIYLESLEQRFFDTTVFKGLVPNLKVIREQSVDFINVAQGVGAGWTIGGIVASQCAYPLTVNHNVDPNDMNIFGEFLPKATCLGDLLAEDGYELVFIGGADKRFAGKEKFLLAHGYKQVLGLNDLKGNLSDDSYVTPWGLYDDTLYEEAIEKFQELSLKSNPFLLTVLTLDSHGYDGYMSGSCQPYQVVNNSMLNSLHCSDQLVAQFINQIRSSPYSNDTLVVVVSDHLAMRNRATPLLEKSSEPRRLTFFINTADKITTKNSNPGVHYDIAPTILDFLGYKINSQMGFGKPLTKGPGYLPEKFGENEWPEFSQKIMAVGNSLWENETVIDKNGISFTASNLKLKIGEKDYDLSAGGFIDVPTTVVYLFNLKTLQVEKIHTYPLEQGLTENKLGELLLDNKDKLALVIGRARFLKGFSDPYLHPDQWALFFGKPDSGEFLSQSITGDFFISPEMIGKMVQGQVDELLVRQRQISLGILAQ